jgi:hypothetical protein
MMMKFFSGECWFQMLHEKKLIDELLSGKVTLLAERVDESTTRKIVEKEATKGKDESTLDDNDVNATTIKVKYIERKEEDSNEVSTKFEEELLFLEERLETPYFDGTCTKIVVATKFAVAIDDRNEESIDDEDDIEWEETMDTYEEFHGILMHWSPEEIRFYYELMLQHSIE